MLRHLLAILLLASTAHAAFEYDGTGDSHVANNPNAAATTEHTVCWKMWDSSYTAGEHLVGYGNGTDSSAGRGWNLVTDGTRGMRINALDGSSAFNGSSGTLFTNSTWHWVCVVNQSGSFDWDVYVDYVSGGSDYNIALDPAAAQNSTDDFYVAESLPAFTGFGYTNFTGRIVYVAYWTVALSTTEIASIHDDSTCPADVQSASLQVFLPLTASPATEEAQSLSVTTNGDPTLVTDPTLASCGSGAVNILPIITEVIGY